MKMCRLLPLLLGLCLSACMATPPLRDRAHRLDGTILTLPAGSFDLRAILHCPAPGPEPLLVFLEGDGRAWRGRTSPSDDPTPVDDTVIQVMAAMDSPCAAYLARPCQYGVPGRGCDPRYWTSHRFAPEVIAAMGQAVDGLKRATGHKSVVLIGYSGGGAVAALLAARRRDVVGLVTLAGVLDHTAWTRHHGVSPLDGSLNPVDVAPALGNVPQLHLQGGADGTVPPETTEDFFASLPVGSNVTRLTLSGTRHGGPWAAPLIRHLPKWVGPG